MQLFLEHDGLAVIECQRGMGRQLAAGLASAQTPTFPIPAGPASFPAQSRGVPIMVGEPVVLKTGGAAPTQVRVLGIIVAVGD
jgi:hypothetical protein